MTEHDLDFDSGAIGETVCECGCTSNDDRYVFPGPGKTVYLLTLSKGCVECDAGAGITIERFDRKTFVRDHEDEFTDGTLPFEKWAYSEGVAIITGHRKHEFVAAIRSHLVGMEASMLNDCGKLDEAGADVILEEAYPDTVVKPHFQKVAR